MNWEAKLSPDRDIQLMSGALILLAHTRLTFTCNLTSPSVAARRAGSRWGVKLLRKLAMRSKRMRDHLAVVPINRIMCHFEKKVCGDAQARLRHGDISTYGPYKFQKIKKPLAA